MAMSGTAATVTALRPVTSSGKKVIVAQQDHADSEPESFSIIGTRPVAPEIQGQRVHAWSNCAANIRD
jgi:hypothetical protein